MAKDTPKEYRNQVMYSVFVRNFSPEGTFEGVARQLPRIKALGVDVIWLMPIHPIGKVCRKGSLGSPYAIRDYRGVNPEFGTLEDFKALVEEIHRLGMKCIIDVVYNHTSPDSVLAEEHPEWFYHKPDGSMGNHIGEWSDVVDLDYTHPALWDYQIETLRYWAGMVDGFRCDVAPLVPLDFWLRAREEVEKVRPGCLWLAESVEPIFIRLSREMGLQSLSDGEIFRAFDVSYDYDVFDHFRDYLEGKVPLAQWAQAVNGQELSYPDNYVKLRFLENHDNLRARFVLPDERILRNWTALTYFQKGMTLLYAGQEVGSVHAPSLFDPDPVDWETGVDFSPLLRRLYEMKKDPLFALGSYHLTPLPREVLLGSYTYGEERLVGVFSLRGEASLVSVDAPDGLYRDAVSGETVEVQRGKLPVKGEPIIFKL